MFSIHIWVYLTFFFFFCFFFKKKTTAGANILKGWDGYLSSDRNVDEKTEFASTDRLFSLSSATAAKVKLKRFFFVFFLLEIFFIDIYNLKFSFIITQY